MDDVTLISRFADVSVYAASGTRMLVVEHGEDGEAGRTVDVTSACAMLAVWGRAASGELTSGERLVPAATVEVATLQVVPQDAQLKVVAAQGIVPVAEFVAWVSAGVADAIVAQVAADEFEAAAGDLRGEEI